MKKEKIDKKCFCSNCEEYVDFDVVEREEEWQVKDLMIKATQYHCICKKCGSEKVACDYYANLNSAILFNKYRKQKGYVTPEQIKTLREKYKLSQEDLSKLLGFGEKQIARYENGSLQDETHNTLLKLACDANVFKTIWEQNKHNLKQKTIKKVEKLLNKEADHTTNLSYRPNFDIILSAQASKFEKKLYQISNKALYNIQQSYEKSSIKDSNNDISWSFNKKGELCNA